MPKWWNGIHSSLRSCRREDCEFESHLGHQLKKEYMEVSRNTFRSALYQAIKVTREQEKAQGYTGPSGFLWVMEDLLAKTEFEESTIYLKD